MRCRKVNILLSAFLDGEISQKDKSLIESHVLKCSSCRKKYGDLQAYAAMTKELEIKTAPDLLRSKVWIALEKGSASKTISGHGILSTIYPFG